MDARTVAEIQERRRLLRARPTYDRVMAHWRVAAATHRYTDALARSRPRRRAWPWNRRRP